jgi:hypothetical protein
MERRAEVRKPNARISNVLARPGIEKNRNRRWIDEAKNQHIADAAEALINIRLR